MRLFRKSRKPSSADVEVAQIRERVRSMRLELGRRDPGLVDLFALLREDDRPALKKKAQVKQAEADRVWPGDVPANPALQPVEAKVTYGDWELMKRPGPFTLR
jgi:hypothetical protein